MAVLEAFSLLNNSVNAHEKWEERKQEKQQ